MNLKRYWKATLEQRAEEMSSYFHKDAYINWHNTNEHFTVSEFIKANCEYPGKWDGEIERIVEKENLIITVVHVFSIDKKSSFHVTSFIQVRDEKIESIDEYWGDDGAPPEWRLEKRIGTPIREEISDFRDHQ